MRPTILAIDDDPLFQNALETVITRFGVDIQVTASPNEFLTWAKTKLTNLYLIDLQLENSNGMDLIPELRKINPNALIMVISGNQSQATVMHALELGATDFILKPLDRELLASKLSIYLNTDPLKEHRAEAVKLNDQQINLKLSFDVKISAIDELGVHLISPHIIPKGAAIRVKSPFFQEIGYASDEPLVTVISTSLDFESSRYYSFAEFDESAQGIVEHIRRWIVSQHTKA